MPRHFRKAVLSTVVNFGGKPVPWERITNDVGVRELNENIDGPLIAELDRLADARKGGITRISLEIYTSLKKNRILKPSPNQPTVFDKLRIADRDSTLVSPKAPKPPPEGPAPSAARPVTNPTPVTAAPVAVPEKSEAPVVAKPFTPRKAKKSAVLNKPEPALEKAAK